jgi:MoaA/NifB/PqqE/SkfB family radical SAM enzyme
MTRLNYWRFLKNFILNNYSFNQCYKPLNAQIELTCKCNAKCVFCSMWTKEFLRELDPDMTTKEVRHVIDGLAKLGVFVITFTGGEPTLRKDLPELIDYAASKGIMPAMVTNGYFLEDMIKSGKLNNVEWIMVSIDWPDAEHHDKYRGIKVFDRAMAGIRAAVLERKQVLISTVITNENIHHMETMVKIARKLDCMIELLPVEDIIREQEGSVHVVDNIDGMIPDLHEYAEEIRRLEKIYPNLVTDVVTASIIEAGGFGNQKLLHCNTASTYIFVKSSGEMVYPCKIHPLLKVNVKKLSPYDVYHSIEVRNIQKKRDSFPFCKGCRLGCAIATSIPSRWSTLYLKYMKAFFNGNLI